MRRIAAPFAFLIVFGGAPTMAAECDGWNTKEFFEIATAADVAGCLGSGADPSARTRVSVKTDLTFTFMGESETVQIGPGTTPLHWAAGYSDDTAVIEALVDSGADPNVRGDGDLTTPLDMAASLSEAPAIIEALIEAGADPNARGEGDFTPLHAAALNNQEPAVIEALIEAGADPNARGEGDFTPLHLAAVINQEPAIIEALIEAGADPNARGVGDSTPLHFAAMGNHEPAIIEALIKAGADPNARGKDDLTPLHAAAMMNQEPAIIEALIKAGADPGARTEDGRTPLDLGKMRDRPSAIIAALADEVGDARRSVDRKFLPRQFSTGLKEVQVWGFYILENEEEIRDAEEYLRRYLEHGESLSVSDLEEFSHHLNLGEERYNRSGQRFCRHVTDEETKDKHPVINPNLRVRLYDREWNVLSEDFLRDEAPQNTKDDAYEWHVIAYVPYHEKGYSLRLVRLENGKEILLEKLAFHSLEKLSREIEQGKFYAYLRTTDGCFLSPPLR